MNTFKNLILVASLSGMMLAPGLAFAGEETNQTDLAQIARGAKAWAEQCSRCHNIRAPSELTDEDLYVSVTHMRVRANIPGKMIEDIIAFLQASNKDE